MDARMIDESSSEAKCLDVKPCFGYLFRVHAREPPMRFLLVVLLLTASSACSSIYTLPPPPSGAPKDVNLTPGADDRESEAAYLAARQSIIKLFGLLQQQRYPEADELLSAETRAFLTFNTDKSVGEVLADGKLTLATGELVEINPVTTLLAEDVSRLVDAVPGLDEQETPSRKEVFAILSNDRAQRIVMIKEAGQWVLHRTRIAQPIPITPSAD